MKQIIAVVKPFLAQRVLESLPSEMLDTVIVREVKGFARQKSYLDEYADSEFANAYLPKVEISLWAADLDADSLIGTIEEVARTGRIGDGKVFVLPVDDAR